jgi:hypothetical protein
MRGKGIKKVYIEKRRKSDFYIKKEKKKGNK